MVRVGLVGTGEWGGNLARVFASLRGARLVRAADLEPRRREEMRRLHPGVAVDGDAADLLRAPDVDAVVVASPAPTHHALAAAALDAGKDCLVEKPLALSARDAEDLRRRARRGGRVLMVGHLLRYHPAFAMLADLVRRGTAGEVRYLYAQRVNLGRVRADENCLWSLAPHDVSMMGAIFGGPPVSVAAHGAAWLRPGVEDVAFLTLRWPGGRLGQVQVSWLDPHKVRRLTVVGSRRMLVFDDMEPREKLRVYDAGVDPPGEHAGPGASLSVRFGEVRVPRVPAGEPLERECAHFVRCVERRGEPLTGADDGLAVVRVLEAATRSLRRGGVPVPLAGGGGGRRATGRRTEGA